MAESDLDQVIAQYHLGLDEFAKGNPEPVIKMLSQRDDVSLANPIGPAVRGWKQVVEAGQRAASQVREGESKIFENLVKVVTPELAFIVEKEWPRTKVGGRPDLATIELRVTTIFRREDGVWKIVHRHADPITSDRPAESMIQK